MSGTAPARRPRGLVALLGVVALALSDLGCGPLPTASAEGGEVTTLDAGGRVSFASFSHTCAIVAGSVQCWGAGGAGHEQYADQRRR